MALMQEIELKFQIPAAALDALRVELSALPGGQRPLQKLQAAYFDTPDRKLAHARAALRVRQEDDDWVQTLKAAGANAMTRLEDNQPVPAPHTGQAIAPDLSRHTDEHVRLALMRDLGWQPEADPRGEHTGLIQLYRTDMQRQRAQMPIMIIRTDPPVSGSVEIALDIGLISAGGLSVPVRELEIELLDGDARAVLVAAQDLVTRYGLWLDVQTKAHRGDQLAREAAAGQPSPLPPAQPRAKRKPDTSPMQCWLSTLDCCIEHISANLSEVALAGIDQDAGQTTDKSPWVRGWALGLRRLMWLGLSAPGASTPCEAEQALMADLRAQLRQLRPAPGQYLNTAQAAELARSVDTTLLSLRLLNTLLEAS
jgi:triphosphatase